MSFLVLVAATRRAAAPTARGALPLLLRPLPSRGCLLGLQDSWRRNASTGKGRSGAAPRTSAPAGTLAVQFRYDQTAAARCFEGWARANTPFTKPPKIVSISSMLLPFWAFRADFSHPELRATRRAVAAPSLQLYAGSAFPRAMLEVAKNPVSSAVPFGPSLLDVGPSYSGRGNAAVDIEPFHTYEATAWTLARSAHVSHEQELHPTLPLDTARATFSNVESFRVLMPVHVIEYTYLFETFRVFVNGATGDAFGIQQRALFTNSFNLTNRGLQDILNNVGSALQYLRMDARLVAVIIQALAAFFRPALKFIFWPPFFIGALLTLGGFVAVRGTASIREQRAYFASWEEQHRSEQAAQASMRDDWTFKPVGRSERDRRSERAAEEEEFAEQQRAWRGRGSAGSTGSTGGSSSSRPGAGTRTDSRTGGSAGAGTGTASAGGRAGPAGGAGAGASSKPRGRMPPPVDGSDYYAVLGIPQGASTEDTQKAFRRELMRFHPDHQHGDGAYDGAACSERTRLIIAAYGVLRDPSKRRAYDASYRGSRRA